MIKIFIIHWSANGHLGWFYFLDIVNSATISTDAQVSLWSRWVEWRVLWVYTQDSTAASFPERLLLNPKMNLHIESQSLWVLEFSTLVQSTVFLHPEWWRAWAVSHPIGAEGLRFSFHGKMMPRIITQTPASISCSLWVRQLTTLTSHNNAIITPIV